MLSLLYFLHQHTEHNNLIPAALATLLCENKGLVLNGNASLQHDEFYANYTVSTDRDLLNEMKHNLKA